MDPRCSLKISRTAARSSLKSISLDSSLICCQVTQDTYLSSIHTLLDHSVDAAIFSDDLRDSDVLTIAVLTSGLDIAVLVLPARDRAVTIRPKGSVVGAALGKAR